MALTVETGQQSTTANSYVTVANYDSYLDARYVGRTDISDAQAEAYILRATDYFEGLNFIGMKATEIQSMQWPRSGINIDGYGKDSNEIPKEVLTAIYELAYGFEQGYGINDPISRETVKEKIGEIEVEYKSSSADRTLLPAATQALRKLIKNPMRVVRA
tara:strand:+ start:577 stop:1056 length:480 start_codon:yes stop_codon:yes gene_type:complete